eukprot:6928411-Prymnesium_polylepis.1
MAAADAESHIFRQEWMESLLRSQAQTQSRVASSAASSRLYTISYRPIAHCTHSYCVHSFFMCARYVR